MIAVSVLSTPTLIAPAGNRDFAHIYNNGSETIYLGYDGAMNIFTCNHRLGFSASDDVTGIIISANDAATLIVGMTVTGIGIPANIFITAIGNPFPASGVGQPGTDQLVILTVTEFTATATNNVTGHGVVRFQNVLTTSNGWPVPAGTWYNLDNDGARNLFNKAVWGIAATGPVDVRVQGI